jgi:hypothetical protein
MEVWRIKYIFDPFIRPDDFINTLAHRAVPVTAGIVVHSSVATFVAFRNMAA